MALEPLEVSEGFGLSDECVENFGQFMRMVELVEANVPSLSPVADKEPTHEHDLICAVCLDLLYSPHRLHPCGHIFCEPCLRRLSSVRIVKCPICRTAIKKCHFDRGN